MTSFHLVQVLLLKVKALEVNTSDFVDELIKIVIEAVRDFSHEPSLFTNLCVEDLLFGYNDPLLEHVKKWIKDTIIFAKFADKINPWFGLEVSASVHLLACTLMQYVYTNV